VKRCQACGDLRAQFQVKQPALLFLCRTCRRQAEARIDRDRHHFKLMSAVAELQRIEAAA
jgi:hypothetical protein